MNNLILQGAALTVAAGAAYLVYTQFLAPADKMGCLESKPEAEGAPVKKAKVEKKEEKKEEFSWNKKKPDPKDFMFSNLKNQVCIKPPGSINGQMFIIEDCENCDIYICDHMAQVQIDYCKNCRIFVGPTESSIFIRNCEDCKCIIACQQYRARECVNCDTLLYASTAPVVEESKNMRFGCFRFFYFNLAQQFEATKMSVYDNKWSEIYDFTPKDGNWSFLDPKP
ncbi:tubulin binding cofactor C-domain-containing protein [Baffinella frigidus]|nr:tubulin binding cofactor C-domain-containing protein [Cryptophyta sp. CCMP2293]